MKKRERRRIGSGVAMWLIVLMSAILLMPFSAAGKYKSKFSRTVDIVVMPALPMEGIPADGAVINDGGLDFGNEIPDATSLEATSSIAIPSVATYSEIPSATAPETASPSPKSQLQAEKLPLSTPSAIIYPNN